MRWIDVRVAGWENSYLTNSPSSSELLPLPQLLSPLRSRVEEWHLSDSCEQEVEVQNTNSLLKGSSPHSSGWAAISDWNPPGPAGPLVLLIASPSLSYNAFAPQCGHEAGLEAAACSGLCCWHQSPSFTLRSNHSPGTTLQLLVCALRITASEGLGRDSWRSPSTTTCQSSSLQWVTQGAWVCWSIPVSLSSSTAMSALRLGNISCIFKEL